MLTYPLEVPVYLSVQDAPLGQTEPTRVHETLSVDVRIGIPLPVAEIQDTLAVCLCFIGNDMLRTE